MNTIAHINHRHFYALLSQMRGVTKEDIVYKWSQGGTTSLSEFAAMCPSLYQEMLETMDNDVSNPEAVKQARSGVLRVMQKIGIDTTNWKEVNAYLESPKICEKRLYNLHLDELHQLRRKLESILCKTNRS